MEEEDDFGHLYTDVLGPLSSSLSAYSSVPPPPPIRRQIDLNLKGSDRDSRDDDDKEEEEEEEEEEVEGDKIPYGQNHAAFPTNETLTNPPSNSIRADNDSARGPRVLVSLDAKLHNKELNSCDLSGFQSGNKDNDIKFDIEEGNVIEDSGPEIPGISGKDAGTDGGSSGKGGGERDEGWEEDSDSEDDLQILLNADNHGPMERGEMGAGNDEEDDDDEDGEPLVIVADRGTNQAMGEQNWAVGEEGVAGAVAEGERKESTDVAGKGIAMVVPKIGYSNHAYPHTFHSQFKANDVNIVTAILEIFQHAHGMQSWLFLFDRFYLYSSGDVTEDKLTEEVIVGARC